MSRHLGFYPLIRVGRLWHVQMHRIRRFLRNYVLCLVFHKSRKTYDTRNWHILRSCMEYGPDIRIDDENKVKGVALCQTPRLYLNFPFLNHELCLVFHKNRKTYDTRNWHIPRSCMEYCPDIRIDALSDSSTIFELSVFEPRTLWSVRNGYSLLLWHYFTSTIVGIQRLSCIL